MSRIRLAALVAALLVALVGCGSGESSSPAASSSAAGPTPTSTEPAKPFGALSIVRSGNGFTVTGEVPDDSMRTSLPDTLRQAMPGARIVDDLKVAPGVAAPEIAGLGGLFGAALDIDGFGAVLDAGTVTLTGKAPSQELKTAAEESAKMTWPGVTVVDDIEVDGVAAANPAGGCSTLGQDVANLLRIPIAFATNGFAVTPDAQKVIAQVADEAKACPGTALTVVGYTDSTGTDAVNVPLSAARAKVVADELVLGGVPSASVTSKGMGAASPVADNGTAQGRAQNRRVDVTVG